MLVICITTAEPLKPQAKQQPRTVATLHEVEHQAHAIGEAYYTFHTNVKGFGPPVVTWSIIPPEVLVRQYHELRSYEGFEDFENSVMTDELAGDECAGCNLASGNGYIPPERVGFVQLNPDDLEDLNRFFGMR